MYNLELFCPLSIAPIREISMVEWRSFPNESLCEIIDENW